ncbi:hypothetical protein KA478_03835 [Patescibacteria group bacterium]|nr:hypothetical protein [Patescibacteria group bacterium]
MATLNTANHFEKDAPFVVEHRSKGDEHVDFVFDLKPTLNHKKAFHDAIVELLIDDDYFYRQWQRYILSPWKNSLDRSQEVIDEVKKAYNRDEIP